MLTLCGVRDGALSRKLIPKTRNGETGWVYNLKTMSVMYRQADSDCDDLEARDLVAELLGLRNDLGHVALGVVVVDVLDKEHKDGVGLKTWFGHNIITLDCKPQSASILQYAPARTIKKIKRSHGARGVVVNENQARSGPKIMPKLSACGGSIALGNT